MKLSLKKNENECLKLLNKKRKGILDEVHLKEKQLSRIDYLRYEMDRGTRPKAPPGRAFRA